MHLMPPTSKAPSRTRKRRLQTRGRRMANQQDSGRALLEICNSAPFELTHTMKSRVGFDQASRRSVEVCWGRERKTSTI